MDLMQPHFKIPTTLNCNGQLVDLSRPKVMGIVNITPDSFYAGSRAQSVTEALHCVTRLVDEGADIIDLGAYSSRPGAQAIDEQVEWDRLAPVLEQIRSKYPTQLLSVDTFRSGIAKRAVNSFGVQMVNDISAGNLDNEMFDTIASLKVPYIIMHMQGNPQNMQVNPSYEHLMKEVFLYFAQKIEILNKIGVADIIIDPGFGFGKLLDQNYEILAKLDEFRIFEMPIIVGLSRKSMIYKHLNITPEESLNATTALNMQALMQGATILRVHDVSQAVECVSLFNKIQEFKQI